MGWFWLSYVANFVDIECGRTMRERRIAGKLTGRQRVFVEAYLTTWNAVEAARQAQYKHPEKVCYRLMKYPHIAEAIAERLSEKAMAADEVLARLAEQARSNLADFVIFKDGELILNDREIRARGHLVKKLAITKYGPLIELYDAQTALIALAKRHGLLVDRSENRIDFIEMTLDEWRQMQQERRSDAQEILSQFEE